MAELAELAKTAGALVVGSMIQKRTKVDPGYFIGSGKLDELKAAVISSEANVVIFDHELAPVQIRNLEEELGIKVIDRTELILDIFALHAKSREGKLQVELAQTTFLLSHLVGQGEALSRQGGRIGTRGPGETKLESGPALDPRQDRGAKKADREVARRTPDQKSEKTGKPNADHHVGRLHQFGQIDLAQRPDQIRRVGGRQALRHP